MSALGARAGAAPTDPLRCNIPHWFWGQKSHPCTSRGGVSKINLMLETDKGNTADRNSQWWRDSPESGFWPCKPLSSPAAGQVWGAGLGDGRGAMPGSHPWHQDEPSPGQGLSPAPSPSLGRLGSAPSPAHPHGFGDLFPTHHCLQAAGIYTDVLQFTFKTKPQPVSWEGNIKGGWGFSSVSPCKLALFCLAGWHACK